MKTLKTTKGNMTLDEINYFLPHEHVVLSLGINSDVEEGYVHEEEFALNIINPQLLDAQKNGISVIADCSPIGTYRDTALMKKAAEMTGVPILTSTGMYCDRWIPNWINDMTYQKLAEIFIKEITEQIDDTGVKAGLIKIGIFKDLPTEKEAKVTRAAACASKETGCAILAHAMSWTSAKAHIDILKEEGCSLENYIWAHSHREYNLDYHYMALDMGCKMQYDGIGSKEEDDLHAIDLVQKMKDRGFADKILISQDRGWFDPLKKSGGNFKPYSYIVTEFADKMRAHGIDEDYINMLLKYNPYNAIAR